VIEQAAWILEEAMATSDPLDNLLGEVSELERFLHAFLARLDPEQLSPKEDLTPYVKKFGLRLPPVLKGALITWESSGESHRTEARDAAQTLVFTRPGHSDAVGLVVKCVTVKKWTVCLECGWIWCRIVVTRRF